MRFVALESPLAARQEKPQVYSLEIHLAYARACLRHSLALGEAPFASHLLYPQVLDDGDQAQRAQGIQAGLAINARAVASVVYVDLGISRGMDMGIAHAQACHREIEFRRLPDPDWFGFCLGAGFKGHRSGEAADWTCPGCYFGERHEGQ